MERKQSGTDGTRREMHPLGRSDRGWLFPVLLLGLLLGLVTVAQWTPAPQTPGKPASPATPWQPSPQPAGETVHLTIDFGNGARKEFATLPWQPEMTVGDLMEAARQFRPGVDFVQIGEGASGFLSSLDGLANQGAGGRNWIYQVDGRHAHVSFCVEKLEPGMHILWRFADELYNGEPP